MQIKDPISIVGLKIELCFREEKLSQATGFIIKNDESFFLVTNWHNVTGEDAITGELLPGCAVDKKPVQIRIHYYDDAKSGWSIFEVDLYNQNFDGIYAAKKWLEHPQGKQVDVVLVPLVGFKGSICVLDLSLQGTDIAVFPATRISIVGFPFRTEEVLPFWITGFIASEPEVNIAKLPLLYINASGYSGLSGSPVILRTDGCHLQNDNSYHVGGGRLAKFIGIYSGRVKGKPSDDLALCRVWKPEVITQILMNKCVKQSKA
jgi:hypothetical protein